MPGRLTLSQRLTQPDGLPTMAARAGVVALMAFAATAGYAAAVSERSSTTAPPRAIAASELAGDLPIATPEAAPALHRAQAIPPLRDDGSAGRRVVASPPEPVATPDPAVTPEPEGTPTPTPSATPVAAPPVAAPPVPAPAPRPTSTPAPTFDLSG